MKIRYKISLVDVKKNTKCLTDKVFTPRPTAKDEGGGENNNQGCTGGGVAE